jgi:single-strand DNA-binding protein
MNKVLLSGRLTRDPETRTLASGKTVTQFSIATNDYRGGTEKSEFHNIVTWDRLAEICGQYLGKGQLVNVEGRIQTRQWEDDNRLRHWKTEIVAGAVEMLAGRPRRVVHVSPRSARRVARLQGRRLSPTLLEVLAGHIRSTSEGLRGP